MGSFNGHALPGSFFFLAGGWWIIAVLYRYHKRRRKGSVQSFYSSPSFAKLQCSCGQTDIEAVLGVIAASIGMFVEIIVACVLRGREISPANMQHATMYFFFGLFALSNLLRPLIRRHFDDDEKIPYILITTALLAEGMLFKFHLYGRTGVDVTVHTLLLYDIFLSAAVTLGEMVYRDSVLLALGRGFFTVLQGTWFWQIGFILYNPLPGAEPWDEEDHDKLMLLACIFTWHVGVIFAAVVLLSFIISKVVRNNNRTDIVLQEVSSSIQNGEQYTALLADHDDEE